MPGIELVTFCAQSRNCTAELRTACPIQELRSKSPYVVNGVLQVKDAVLDGVADVVLRIAAQGDFLIDVPFHQLLVLGTERRATHRQKAEPIPSCLSLLS